MSPSSSPVFENRLASSVLGLSGEYVWDCAEGLRWWFADRGWEKLDAFECLRPCASLLEGIDGTSQSVRGRYNGSDERSGVRGGVTELAIVRINSLGRASDIGLGCNET